MNSSLGGAVSPSTKRGRSPRLAGAATAANRDVAPSRVGKYDARGETGRQSCPSTASGRLCRYSATGGRRSGQPKQGMPSIELNSTAMVRTRDRRSTNDGNNSDAASGQGVWVHQGRDRAGIFLSPKRYLWRGHRRSARG